MENLKGFKTLGVSALVALAGVAQSFDWATVIPQDKFWSGMVFAAMGGVFAYLRKITDSPVGKK